LFLFYLAVVVVTGRNADGENLNYILQCILFTHYFCKFRVCTIDDIIDHRRYYIIIIIIIIINIIVEPAWRRQRMRVGESEEEWIE